MNPNPPAHGASLGKFLTCLVLASLLGLSAFQLQAQSPSVLYTWPGTGNVQQWAKNFGTNTVTLDNSVTGELHVTETGMAGSNVAISDGANRVRETPSGSSGGLDLTGLDYLEFDLGHNGAGNINVQFFVQASTAFNYVALGPDLTATPGVHTFQVPLAGLTPAQLVYVRSIGFLTRDHAALGNVVWTLREVRAGGAPLTTRNLVTHDTGTSDGGLQGAIVNFDNGSVVGNDGGQNQTGLSHNAGGSGSLRWTDIGGQQGAAISWGNGTVFNGSTFNERTTDLSNYETMTVRISATEVSPGPGGSLNVSGFFQVANFSFRSAGIQSLPIDGQYHDLTFSLVGIADMNVVDLTGINLNAHAADLTMNVDSIRFDGAPVKFNSISRAGQNIVLKFSTSPGQIYSIEYSPNVIPGNWTTLMGNILGNGQEATVTDANALLLGVRFYRVKLM